jgi:acetyl esterase/lipase
MLLSLAYSYPSVFAWWYLKKIPGDLQQSYKRASATVREHGTGLFPLLKIPSLTPRSYCYDEAHGLYLDFYRNDAPSEQACVVVVHGGGWDSGDRRQLHELNSVLASQGIAVAAISYRLAPTYTFPAPLEDLRKAKAFLQQEHRSLGIFSDCFFYLGRSAGGQIVLTEAYRSPDKDLRGVIAFYAPADMAWGYQFPCWKYVMDSRQVQRQYMGATPNEAPGLYESASANLLVANAHPPALLLCGRNDVLTSFHHNTRLLAAFQKNSVPHYLVDIPYGVHGFDYFPGGPSAQISTLAIKQFILMHTQQ